MYFSLSEVSARWHRQTKDVEYCIENGLLNAHIKVCSVKLTSNMLLNKFPHNSQEIYEYTGCKRITPEDCHILFRHYKRQVSEFISSDDTKREKLVFPEKITIKKVDLMILLCDLKQFEEKYQLKYEEQDLPLWNNNVSSSEIAVNNDCDFFYIGNNIDVKRGQIITGRMELAQTLRLSERQIRTALDKLKMSGVITIKTTNQYSLITVENYSCFQNLSAENDQPKAKQPTNQKSAESPSNSQQRVRPVSTTQEDKNLKTKISSLHSDILSKSSQKPVTSKKMSFADLLKSKGIA